MKETDYNEQLRDKLALEYAKSSLNAQLRYRRMSVIDRILFYLGSSKFYANFDPNYNQIIEQSYRFADDMIKQKNKTNK